MLPTVLIGVISIAFDEARSAFFFLDESISTLQSRWMIIALAGTQQQPLLRYPPKL